ncbi:MAG: hypothetical protein K9N35_06505 [Candidatus Marinimicrobia bacterium]|nr:hypothetical protein [Candidatus Neomarinimicrobiota bacterium]
MNDPPMMMSVLDYRRLALMSLWIGLISTVGVVFAFIPNMELVTLTAFLGGIALGPGKGFLVAMLGEALFSAINPIGSGLGFPILYLFQIAGIGLSGLSGGLLAKWLISKESVLTKSIIMGFLGLILTFIFDLLTALSFPLSAGMTEGTLLATIGTGMLFFVMHMVSNTILFTLFGAAFIDLIDRQLLMHGLKRI